MPTPMPKNKHESEQDFMSRCLKMPGMNRSKCRAKWAEKQKGKKNMRIIETREYKSEPDLDKIRSVAGNPELTTDQVFDFGTFVVCKSGVNRNGTDITAEGQKAAVNDWIGVPIYFKDHETEASNQIGRIYDSWIEERHGETVTLGKGFGVMTSDLADIFTRIENKIHKEMSCAYEPTKSVCSECNSDLIGDHFMVCGNGHSVGRDGVYALDLAFVPDHISFVGRPGVEGAGLIAADDQNKMLRVFADLGDDPEQTIQELRRDAEDGKEYRSLVRAEFVRWYGLSNKDANGEEIELLADKLSAKEMAQIAKMDKERFNSLLPGGGKQLSVSPPVVDEASVMEPEFKNLKDLFQNREKK